MYEDESNVFQVNCLRFLFQLTHFTELGKYFVSILLVDLDSTPQFTSETWGCNPRGVRFNSPDLHYTTTNNHKKKEFVSFMVHRKRSSHPRFSFFLLLLRHLRRILKQKKGLSKRPWHFLVVSHFWGKYSQIANHKSAIKEDVTNSASKGLPN